MAIGERIRYFRNKRGMDAEVPRYGCGLPGEVRGRAARTVRVRDALAEVRAYEGTR